MCGDLSDRSWQCDTPLILRDRFQILHGTKGLNTYEGNGQSCITHTIIFMYVIPRTSGLLSLVYEVGLFAIQLKTNFPSMWRNIISITPQSHWVVTIHWAYMYVVGPLACATWPTVWVEPPRDTCRPLYYWSLKRNDYDTYFNRL